MVSEKHLEQKGISLLSTGDGCCKWEATLGDLHLAIVDHVFPYLHVFLTF